MANRKNLLNWYKTDIDISKQKLEKDNKKLNNFWIRWGKSKLFIKRLRFLTIIKNKL